MNETRYEYRDEVSDDRQFNMDKFIKDLDDMAEHHKEVERINKITQETGYWFEGIKYD